VAAQSQDVFDVSGTGDMVLVTLAWGLLQDFSLLEAVHAAN
jgi:bifunctional ADP-heptose synthase (sugar kinase/adenylyltransferase)